MTGCKNQIIKTAILLYLVVNGKQENQLQMKFFNSEESPR